MCVLFLCNRESMSACTYARMRACMGVRMQCKVCMHACVYVCNVCMSCMYACMYVFIDACYVINVCMYVCMYVCNVCM